LYEIWKNRISENVDFTLPSDAPKTMELLNRHQNGAPLEVYVGCAKWNRADLKGFYPRGTKDELTYYSRQFNAIEMNATFYKMPDIRQVEIWKNKTPKGFKFFPKIPNIVTHYRRLINVREPIDAFCDAVSNFEDRLGMAFMQLHENFTPKDFDRLKNVLQNFPKAIPLAVEVRNERWFSDPKILEQYSSLLEQLGMSNIIVDTAGRRDMLHMRLTSSEVFIRYVGANHPSDIQRLDDWVGRILQWRKAGLQKLYFFVHQNIEIESPLLATHFIQKLNRQLGLSLDIPKKNDIQNTLF
jgi:uncharacterized protein YecE (DUF72 family)